MKPIGDIERGYIRKPLVVLFVLSTPLILIYYSISYFLIQGFILDYLKAIKSAWKGE